MPTFIYEGSGSGRIVPAILWFGDEPTIEGRGKTRYATHAISENEARLGIAKLCKLYPPPVQAAPPAPVVMIETRDEIEEVPGLA